MTPLQAILILIVVFFFLIYLADITEPENKKNIHAAIGMVFLLFMVSLIWAILHYINI